MGKKVVERLQKDLGAAVLATSEHRGDFEVRVAKKDWKRAATLLRGELEMDHIIDLTAVDYPEREPEEPRFELKLILRSSKTGHRIRIATRAGDGEKVDSLTSLWRGANWAEREIWDMFGIPFEGHPDLRRILMYPEFEGFPLRKDYPIGKTQPLVPYREVEGIEKLPPFGDDEGQPWGRIDWLARLRGEEVQVSPAIGQQTGGRRALSSGPEHDGPLPEAKE
ncbi:MAG: NADH-quinone oxidoreductase subunit C [Sandaracinaceae bacterium]|nr:NADH-quinone oxidoreductase subunit C [Sandaracinaceae bacterium]